MTAHADICSRLNNLALINGDDAATSQALTEAASLIQQMAGELEASRANHIDANTRNMQANERAESAESQLADLRAKIAAADAGMPEEPPIFAWSCERMVTAEKEISGEPYRHMLYIQASKYDSLRAFATAQAVRIAEFDEAAIYEKCAKVCEDQSIEWGDGEHGLLPIDGRVTCAKAIRALQPAAKHD